MGSDKPCCCGFLITSIWLARPAAGYGHPTAEVPEAMRTHVSAACLLQFTASNCKRACFPGKRGYTKAVKQSKVSHSLLLAPSWEQ